MTIFKRYKILFSLVFFAVSLLRADNVSMLKNYIKSEYVKIYPEINIESISLITRDSLDLHKIEIVSKSLNNSKNANGYMNISYKINNKMQQENIKYSLKANIRIYYATDNIPAKSNFKAANFTDKTQEFSIFTSPPASKIELLQSSAKVYIPINSVITRNKIAKRILVAKDSNVKIMFKSGGIEAISSGRALENGMKNDIIKIENNESKRVINAQVVNENEVKISE